jgi:acyl-CoA synthetase (AMP-forming)/AMP-acid ligase II
MDIRKTVEATARRYPTKTAVHFKDQQISFSQLHENSLKLAHALKNLGVSKGDKIGIFLPNSPEYLYSYLACFYLGAVGVPLDFMLKTDELVSCLSHSETNLLIALPKNDVNLLELKSQIPTLKNIVSLGNMGPEIHSLGALLSRASIELTSTSIDDQDPALIMYTSGTTGKPKGILLTYKHLEGSPKAMEHFVDLTDRDIKLTAIPLSHIGGFIYLQNCVIFGITLVLMERFQPVEFLENVQKYRVSCFHIVPPMYTAILTLKNIEKFDLSSLRWVVVFGAPSSLEIMERFHQYCPNAKLLNGWGMTETCPPNTVTPFYSQNISSVGKPAPNCEIKIFDENSCEVSAGEIGEIVIRGWIVMKEYYKDPQATEEVLKNGWLYTGDLGRFDKEGFLYIVGRKKEMIKVAGQIVYAPEVESALYKHEAVAEAAVIGVPDKLKGEAVKAFVVIKPGVEVTIEDLRYFARQHLANFKVPHDIELRESLPKNRTGKIDKSILKEDALTRS